MWLRWTQSSRPIWCCLPPDVAGLPAVDRQGTVRFAHAPTVGDVARRDPLKKAVSRCARICR